MKCKHIWFIFLFSILSAQFVIAAQPVSLRILYVNDFHGFAESHQTAGDTETLGGAAFLAAAINQFRKGQPTLLLAAGDFIQGNPWVNLFEGKSAIELMNAMDFSAMTLGNHEFDFGVDILHKRVREARFPVLAANVQGLSNIQPFIIKEISGLKVAIIGLVTEETPVTTHPKNVKDLTFSSAIDTAKKIIGDLDNTVDVVIVLSHLGLSADIQLARAVHGIDVIVGGHSHTRIEKPMKIDETLIVQSWEHGKTLGILDLTVQDMNITQYDGNLALIQPGKRQPDPSAEEIVGRYRKQASAILNEVIGEAQITLDGKNSRSRETNLGNLLSDILKKATHADIALINGGGIRADILKGPVRMNDILSVLPFANHPVVLKVNGKELKDIFEYGLADVEGMAGRFPQVSGIQITYNPANPAGAKITDLKVAGSPVCPESWYTLATNDFLAAGGDGYVALKNLLATMTNTPEGSPQNNRVILFDSGRAIRDMVIDYIKDNKRISASVESRIRKEE